MSSPSSDVQRTSLSFNPQLLLRILFLSLILLLSACGSLQVYEEFYKKFFEAVENEIKALDSELR